MDFELSEEALMIRDMARRFVKEEMIPLERLVIERESNRGMGDDPILPADVEKHLYEKSKEIGLWGIDVEEKFGGHNLGALVKCLVSEQMFYSITPFMLPPDSPNLQFLSECCKGDQIDRYLLPYARGEKKSCLALSEPSAGSDAGAIKLRAINDGGKWVLNGEKMWISGVKTADFMIVMAVTDPELRNKGGITAFLVDRDTPGVSVPSDYAMIGGPFHPYSVHFDNVILDQGQILGEIGNGFQPLLGRLGIRRMEIACWCLGHASRCLDMMIEQSKSRSTFGTLLSDRQAIQWWIADSYQEIEMVRLLIYRLAWLLDQPTAKENGIEIARSAAMAKIQATEMASRVIDRAIQLYGGMGLSKEMPFEYMLRSVRTLRIVEGPSEVHRWTIARDLLKNGRGM